MGNRKNWESERRTGAGKREEGKGEDRDATRGERTTRVEGNCLEGGSGEEEEEEEKGVVSIATMTRTFFSGKSKQPNLRAEKQIWQ